MSEEIENKENTEDKTVGATESRLLQAMSVSDEEDAVPAELPEYVAYAGTELAQDAEKTKMFDIVEKIRTVSDPEIPLNVYDMGLIYKIDQSDNGDIYIEMTVTAPTCPIAGELPQQVADAVSEVAGTGKIEVKIVWEPAWTPERMTDEAKEMLELI